MKRLGIFFLLAGMAVLTVHRPLLAQKAGGGNVSTSYELGPENKPELLTGSERYSWQRPDRVIGMLAVREGERVADIGAGTGYFSKILSNLVGLTGKVYAVEFDSVLLDQLEKASAEYRNANTTVIHATETDPGLPVGELDLALSVNTWHRFGDRTPIRAAVKKALKPGGRFVVVDWHMGEIPMLPAEARRLSREDLIKEMVADGWTLTTDSRLLAYQYLLIFSAPVP